MYFISVLFWVRGTFRKIAKVVVFFQFFEQWQELSLRYNFVLNKLTLPINIEMFTIFDKFNVWLFPKLAVGLLAFLTVVEQITEQPIWSYSRPATA